MIMNEFRLCFRLGVGFGFRSISALAGGVLLVVVTSACGLGPREAGLKSAGGDLVYIAGTQDAPELSAPGPGAGDWNSAPWTMSLWSEAQAIRAFLETGLAKEKYGREACAAFQHYFDNTGLIWTFDAGKMGDDVPHVGAIMEREVARAVDFIRGMPRGQTEFTSQFALASRVERAQSLNWYLAVADFSYYVTGRVDHDACGRGCARAEIFFHIWDRYDWDPGPVVRLNTPVGAIDVDQVHVGEFHRQGIAKEFTSLGLKRFKIEVRGLGEMERTMGLEPTTSSLGS